MIGDSQKSPGPKISYIIRAPVTVRSITKVEKFSAK